MFHLFTTCCYNYFSNWLATIGFYILLMLVLGIAILQLNPVTRKKVVSSADRVAATLVACILRQHSSLAGSSGNRVEDCVCRRRLDNVYAADADFLPRRLLLDINDQDRDGCLQA